MTKREQYGLSFYKVKSPIDGEDIFVCKKHGMVNEYNTLQILARFNEIETQGFIDELDNALNGDYYEEYFAADGTEYISIHLSFPNVIFGENDLTISMTDLKILLEEWLEFINE